MANEYRVSKIGEGTFAIEEKTAVNQGLCYLLCGEERAMLIDTGLGYPSLVGTVRGITKLPVFVANTHGHVDHIGGNHFFGEIWLHQNDREVFKKHCDPDYTLGLLAGGAPRALLALMRILLKKRLAVDPGGDYHYFDDSMVFHLGGRDVEVIPTPGHTPGSVCFLDRRERMLFSGDTVCEWGILLHFRGESCPPEVYKASVERLISFESEYDTLWPGHHGYPVDKKYLQKYLACAESILNGTAEYKTVNGARSAIWEDILISVPEEG